jgi:hypothetical protein
VSDGVWIVVSILALGAAAVLALTGQFNAAFVAATLGAVAWFLNYRSRIKPATPEGDADEDDADDGDGSDGEE